MKTRYTLLLLFISLCITAQENIIPNGGFERYNGKTPIGWSFGWLLGFERDRDAHSGRYSVNVWANGDDFYTISNGELHIADVKAHSEYLLSYWHKGNLPQKDIIISVLWYKDNQRLKTDVLREEQVLTSPDKWQKKEISIISPMGANRVGLSFRLNEHPGYNVNIDDVSMVFVKKIEEVKIPIPTGLTVKTHQREIELSWDKEVDADLKWEVQVNDETPQKTYKNSFVVENLTMNTPYNLKVRAVKNGHYSDFTPVRKAFTQGMKYAENDLERVPHLRTLGTDGECQQELKLYYYDLATPNARIQYFSDGIELKPISKSTLLLPKKGKQQLKVIIEESTEKTWEIDYNIEVK